MKGFFLYAGVVFVALLLFVFIGSDDVQPIAVIPLAAIAVLVAVAAYFRGSWR